MVRAGSVWLGLVCIGLAAMTFTGCATSGPKMARVRQELAPIPKKKGRIFFYRESAFVGSLLRPSVKLNGDFVGEMPNGSVFFEDVDPGEYKVAITTELTNETTVIVAAGEEQYVRITPYFGLLVGRFELEWIVTADAQRAADGLSFVDSKSSGGVGRKIAAEK